jgi:hypothetical protein
VRELAASFEKIRLICDFTVSGEIWRVRAIRLLEKPWLIIGTPPPRAACTIEV